jgi:MFS family permease
VCPATDLQLVFLGAFLGAGIFGYVCDRWGRRNPLFISTAMIAAPMLASLAAPSYWPMAALRCVTGIGASGQAHCIFLLAMSQWGLISGELWRCVWGGGGYYNTSPN